MKYKIALMLIVFLCVLASCQRQHKNDDVVKLDIIHILQEDDYSCATTSLAMAISYFENARLDKKEFWKRSKSDVEEVKYFGNDMDGLKRVADHFGYKSEFKEDLSIEDIEGFLSNGIPIVINVLLNPNTKGTHAVLVVGFDSDKKVLFINDPSPSLIGKQISYQKLKDLWKGHLNSPRKMSHRSGFILYPKNPN